MPVGMFVHSGQRAPTNNPIASLSKYPLDAYFIQGSIGLNFFMRKIIRSYSPIGKLFEAIGEYLPVNLSTYWPICVFFSTVKVIAPDSCNSGGAIGTPQSPLCSEGERIISSVGHSMAMPNPEAETCASLLACITVLFRVLLRCTILRFSILQLLG